MLVVGVRVPPWPGVGVYVGGSGDGVALGDDDEEGSLKVESGVGVNTVETERV